MSSHATTYVSFLEAEKGFKSWLTTLDHKRIGLMYMATSMIFFMIGGIFATLVRLELMFPGQTIMSAGTYNKFFTYHGAIMIFMFIIPIIPAALGNFFLPIMIGAKDVAFPRLNLASYYIFIAGASFAVLALMLKGADTGWTFYTPYSIRSGTSVVLVALGVFIMGFSGILTGLNFMTTVHKLRAPGMTFHRMPLFVWAIYATAIIQVLATPVIGITTLLLIMERVLGIGFFDPALGGDPVLFQHFFWFYSHPAVYIMILPAMGIISEVIPVFSRKHIFGYHAIAYSSLAIAFISFVVWGHHMFVSSQSDLANMLFSFLTMFVAVPTAIKVFNWTATMYKGSISLKTPMLYALSFLFMFTIGGLTGLFLAALSVDVHLHDTYFVVAHFHYVMMGGTVMGLLAGLHYWWPKMFGKMYPEIAGKISWALIFIGFNLTFLTQFFVGYLGMPRRYYDYPVQYTSWNIASTIGSWFLFAGFLLMLIYFVKSLFFGKRVAEAANPWGGKTLEWQIPSPPPMHNFAETPHVTGRPYEYGVAKL
ncbi:MAG: cytochrome c oxidase subunit I [Deltaproteobacteria bacterium RIFCSPLOWO2_12_FULL_44_12]|nr:MAG: cytochrome c oxidase subunit I [Deltaproteobacteria bacterium RIFCSPHIGHO2_01_FULL_43_49]OGQ14923.1 MAG: cytochrome c oxidase subunit I [Deltaproteobacteria bacterium RIFCSPHIGHO2_02_FULL_44_53]OGQ29573.1 MAG: cytochrome c oxidase subunit I [Deltaproteobacteria bacterium RIFCSPHIGHO2_12_FULL_44_21]OGQ31035.1 MAG: cytochrome c oxidase subunit I [Deltaproteobacteria bacterium RIFCSPLOWO2_01_FULL_45_74]OGQ42637.1 MAG: cytochrome c oxidase subunit I [Deltaproteobacteria bacterium RIFCSPLOWO